jgi:hypothetical protein
VPETNEHRLVVAHQAIAHNCASNASRAGIAPGVSDGAGVARLACQHLGQSAGWRRPSGPLGYVQPRRVLSARCESPPGSRVPGQVGHHRGEGQKVGQMPPAAAPAIALNTCSGAASAPAQHRVVRHDGDGCGVMARQSR